MFHLHQKISPCIFSSDCTSILSCHAARISLSNTIKILRDILTVKIPRNCYEYEQALHNSRYNIYNENPFLPNNINSIQNRWSSVTTPMQRYSKTVKPQRQMVIIFSYFEWMWQKKSLLIFFINNESTHNVIQHNIIYISHNSHASVHSVSRLQWKYLWRHLYEAGEALLKAVVNKLDFVRFILFSVFSFRLFGFTTSFKK